MLGPVFIQAAAFGCTVPYGRYIYIYMYIQSVPQSVLHSPWENVSMWSHNSQESSIVNKFKHKG